MKRFADAELIGIFSDAPNVRDQRLAIPMAAADPPELRTILSQWVCGKMGCDQRRRRIEPSHASLLANEAL
jgi:hypothetical protein